MLLACHGQLRLAPGGQVLGVDMGTALLMAKGRGADIAVMSELLPAAEAGLVQALTSESQGSGGNSPDSERAVDKL